MSGDNTKLMWSEHGVWSRFTGVYREHVDNLLQVLDILRAEQGGMNIGPRPYRPV